MKRWYDRAKGWYEKAVAAHPDDMMIARRLTEFYVQTKQMNEVEAQLDPILKSAANPKNAEIKAWARRTLARSLASSTDPQRLADAQRLRRALDILDPTAPVNKGKKGLDDPDDLRVLALVLAAHRSEPERKRAIAIIATLEDKKLASAEDLFFLAQSRGS